LNLFYKTISLIVITDENTLLSDKITCSAYPSKNAVKTFYPENITNNNRLTAMQNREVLPTTLKSDSFACTHSDLLKHIILMQSTANRLIALSQQSISTPDYVRDAYFCDTILLFNADLGTVSIDLIIAIWYNMFLQGVRVPKLVLISKYRDSPYLEHLARVLKISIKEYRTVAKREIEYIEVDNIQSALDDLQAKFTFTSGNYCIIVPTSALAENMQSRIRVAKIYSETLQFALSDILKIVICLPEDFLGTKLRFDKVFDLNLVSAPDGYMYNSKSAKRSLSNICANYFAYKYTDISAQAPIRQMSTAVLSFHIGILLVNHIDPRQIFEHDPEIKEIIDREIIRLEREGSIVSTGRVITLLPLKIRSINMHITIEEAALIDKWLATGNAILPIAIFVALKHNVGSLYNIVDTMNLAELQNSYAMQVPQEQRGDCNLTENIFIIMHRFTETYMLDSMTDNDEFIATYKVKNAKYFHKIIEHVSLMLSVYHAETKVSITLGVFDIEEFYEALSEIADFPIMILEGDLQEKTYVGNGAKYSLCLKDSILYAKSPKIVLVSSRQNASGKKYITCYFPVK
jgi:hypothetical protein